MVLFTEDTVFHVFMDSRSSSHRIGGEIDRRELFGTLSSDPARAQCPPTICPGKTPLVSAIRAELAAQLSIGDVTDPL